MGDGAPPTGVDLAAIRGQSPAGRALEVGAAGRHNLLMLRLRRLRPQAGHG
jgi:predicted ATPase with chaperone activity